MQKESQHHQVCTIWWGILFLRTASAPGGMQKLLAELVVVVVRGYVGDTSSDPWFCSALSCCIQVTGGSGLSNCLPHMLKRSQGGLYGLILGSRHKFLLGRTVWDQDFPPHLQP